MIKQIEAIYFDLGDTLMYFDDDWSHIFYQARQELHNSLLRAGIVMDEKFADDFYQRMTAYYRDREAELTEYSVKNVLVDMLADNGYLNVPESVLLTSLADMYVVTQVHWLPEPEMFAVLEQLRQKGYRMALISNASDDADIQLLVDKLNIRAFFEVIVSSAAFGMRKPSPKIFSFVLEQMHLPADKVAMVGDTLGADILGAQNSGIFSIWIKRRAAKPGNQLSAATIFPDAQIDNLSELPGLLEKLAAGV